MSAEQQPDPILPNYNPSSWDVPTLSAEERAILDTEYITFPIAQNQNITFPTAPTAPTLADGTNTTQVATTGFVQNAITAFLSTINSWTALQIFSAGMTSNTINPTTTSGTLNIGNAAANTNVEIATSTSRTGILRLGAGDSSTAAVHINNGLTTTGNVQILNGAGSTGTITLGTSRTTPSVSSTLISLGAPMTPAYSYPIGAGKIGQIIEGTLVAGALTLVTDTPKSVASLTLGNAGIWLFFAQVHRTIPTANTYFTIALGTVLDSASFVISDTDVVSNAIAPSQTFSWTFSASAITYYLTVISGEGGTASNVIYRAVRLA